MNICIFTGPTLRPKIGRTELDAIYLPPASQGDVYRVAEKKPYAIGIIDGYFDRVPAVWHKEILWAMAQGIHVFGAASMGALRAAELAPFGMEGIGWIYEAFRDGVLEDDDEVAVVHSETFAPLSEAMVNIRRTFEKAEVQGVITSMTRSALTEGAKRIFYPKRTYPYILKLAQRLGVPSQEISQLEQWLPAGRVDQKYEDAVALLRALRIQARAGRAPKKVNFRFESTYFWEQLRHEAGELRIDSTSCQTIFTNSILDELRLEDDLYITATEWCLTRLLVREPVSLLNNKVDATSFLETVVWFRERHGLLRSTDLEEWLQEHLLTKEQFLELMDEEDKLRQAQSVLAEQVDRLLPTYLRLTGRYSRLADRAAHKHKILSKIGLENPTSNDTGLSDSRLLKWYFRERFRKAPPRSLALFVRRLGFRNEGDFIHTVRREKCYVMHMREQKRSTHARHTQLKKRKMVIRDKSSRN